MRDYTIDPIRRLRMVEHKADLEKKPIFSITTNISGVTTIVNNYGSESKAKKKLIKFMSQNNNASREDFIQIWKVDIPYFPDERMMILWAANINLSVILAGTSIMKVYLSR